MGAIPDGGLGRPHQLTRETVPTRGRYFVFVLLSDRLICETDHYGEEDHYS